MERSGLFKAIKANTETLELSIFSLNFTAQHNSPEKQEANIKICWFRTRKRVGWTGLNIFEVWLSVSWVSARLRIQAKKLAHSLLKTFYWQISQNVAFVRKLLKLLFSKCMYSYLIILYTNCLYIKLYGSAVMMSRQYVPELPDLHELLNFYMGLILTKKYGMPRKKKQGKTNATKR